MSVEERTVQQRMQQIAEVASRITANVEQVIIGKGDAVRLTLIAVLCQRHHPDVYLGVSPRGSLALCRTSQALAALRGREYVIPDDVKALVKATLTHRIIVAPAARVRGATARALLDEMLESVPVPKAWVGSRSSCVPGRGLGRTTRISSGQ